MANKFLKRLHQCYGVDIKKAPFRDRVEITLKSKEDLLTNVDRGDFKVLEANYDVTYNYYV